MKKFYLAAAAFITALVPALAQRPLTMETDIQSPLSLSLTAPQVSHQIMQAPKANDVSMDLGYCDDLYTAIVNINPGETGMAIQFPASMLKDYAGNQISSILFASGIDSSKSTQGNFVNSATKCTVFISESLNGDPVYEQDATISNRGYIWNTIDLTAPYTIPEGKSLYVGVIYHDITANDCVITIDNAPSVNDKSFYVYSRMSGVASNGAPILQENYAWKAFAQYLGDVGNACIKAKVSGDNLPKDRSYILDFSVPDQINTGENFQMIVAARNEGANAVQNVEVTMTIGDAAPQTATCNMLSNTSQPISVAYGEYGFGLCEFSYDKEGNNIPFTAYISKVNGVENQMKDKTVTGTLLSLTDGFDINVVGEELTSIRCSACPVALTVMEKMKEKYGADNRFIPIGVHANIPQPRDPMDVCSEGDPYYQFMASIGYAPALRINRRMKNDVQVTSMAATESELNYWFGLKSMAKLNASITKTDDDQVVDLNITMESAINDNSGYGFAYTIVEDNLGPYLQVNGYAGMQGDYYGWENKSSSTPVTYNDVARKGSVYTPIANSVPASIEKGKTYSYTAKVNIAAVNNLANYRIVPMLINTKTGYIENACVAVSPDSGIDSVQTETSGAVAVGLKGAVNMLTAGNIFAVDGRVVATDASGIVELPAGVYLVATPAGNAKVLVR